MERKVDRMAVNHGDVLRALHDEHGPALFRYVMRLTSDRSFAQDVVQESLLRAWKKPEILEQSDEAARAWLFTVARNLVIDDRRSARFSHEIGTDTLPESATPDRTESVFDAWMRWLRSRSSTAGRWSARTTSADPLPRSQEKKTYPRGQ
jgi:RNA polymerase sigma-70 factor (ECF subfamily)